MAILKYSVIVRQYTVIVIANFTYFTLGLSIGWLSPLLVKLSDPNQTVLREPLSAEDGAWITSVGFLMALISMFFTEPLVNRIGRKNGLICAVLPRITLAIIFLFTTEKWLMILGRVISGFGDFFTISITTTYFSEIASKEIRGALGLVSQFLSSIGSIIMLTTGPFVSYKTLNILHVSVLIAASLPILFLPESPYFLYTKGKNQEAMKILTFLRGSEQSAFEEIKEYSELSSENVKINEMFREKVVLKTILKTVLLAIAVELVGYNAVFMYLQTVFEMTHTKISSGVSTAIIGCVQLLATFCSMIIVDRFGRKPIFIISLLGLSLGMCGLGIFFKLTEYTKPTGFLNYLPIISVIAMIYCFNAGFGALQWVVIAEMLDSRFRPIGTSIAVFFGITSLFFVVRFGPSIILLVGPGPTYLAFAVISFLTCVYIGICIPETKGKAYSEIQKIMGRKMERIQRNENDDNIIKISTQQL